MAFLPTISDLQRPRTDSALKSAGVHYLFKNYLDADYKTVINTPNCLGYSSLHQQTKIRYNARDVKNHVSGDKKTMTQFLKIWAIWMLVLVLPAQALASAAKTSCGPAHASIAPTQFPSSYHAHDDIRPAAHHHEQIVERAADNATSNASDSADTYKSAFCSACAACCVGAAAVSSNGTWISKFTGSSMPALAPPSLLAGFIPAGLERPPRHFFLV